MHSTRSSLFLLFTILECVESRNVLISVGEAVQIFDSNTVGPKSYIRMYDTYKDILTGQSERDKDEFLKSEASLEDFRERMTGYADLRDEISLIRQTVQLNLFGLSCKELNLEMFTRTENLRLGLIKFQVKSPNVFVLQLSLHSTQPLF